MDGRQLWTQYAADPDRHPNIPNCSYAGYHYGESPLPVPRATIRKAVDAVNVRDLGAKGDGVTDDTAALQRAVREAPCPGAVYVPSGDYVLTDILRITRSDLTVYGDGPGRTRLQVGRPLSDILGPFSKESGEDRWSILGGLVWVAPPDIWRADGTYRHQQPDRVGPDIGWPARRLAAAVAGGAKRGDDTLTIHLTDDRNDSLPEGWLVMVWHQAEDYSLLEHIGGHPAFEKYPWEEALRLHFPWYWPVEIADVLERNGDRWRVRLQQPLRIDVRPEWRVTLEVPEPDSRNADDPAYLEEVGLESLSIWMPPHRSLIHMQDLGYNGIYFQRAFHCWVRDVVIENPDNGIIAGSTKCLTVKDTRILGPETRHHGYYLRYCAHDCLITDFEVGDCGYEALSIACTSSGCVFHDGILWQGTFDSHRGLPFDVLRANIRLVSGVGKTGGGVPAGPRNGARVAHWNLLVEGGDGAHIYQPLELAVGALVGIRGVALNTMPGNAMPPGDKGTIVADQGKVPEPVDLYRAQVALRLGRLPSHLQ